MNPFRRPNKRSSSFKMVLLCAAAAGCSGEVASPENETAQEQGPKQNPGRTSSGGASGSAGGAGAGAPGDGPSQAGPSGPVVGAACKPAALPPARVWRLSGEQYANTFQSLFGITVPRDRLPPDATAGGLFVDAEAATVTDQLAGLYRDTAAAAAKTLGPAVMKDFACLQTKPAASACVDGFVDAYAGKAFRRPLAADERQAYAKLFAGRAAKAGPDDAAQLVLEAIFQSPSFLYRTELGGAAPANDGRVALSPFELASQLSYMIADAPPDAELMKAAAANELRDPAAVRKHGERLLAMPKARAKLVDFFSRLLHLQELGTTTKDAKAFPSFTPELRQAMLTETETFVDRTLWEEKGSLGTLFSAEHSYLNAALAKLYGAPAAGLGTDFKKTPLPGGKRRGLIAQASVLTTLASAEGTSPAHRGLLFRETLLCQPVPPPPPDAADQAPGKILSPEPKLTQREHFEYARKAAPECVACHGHFVPLGLSLEKFDGIGAYRETEFGKPLDTQVTLSGYGDADGVYADGIELAQRIVASERGRECFTAHVWTFAFGRTPGAGQSCGLAEIAARFGKGGLRVQDLWLDVVQSPSFWYRQPSS